MDSKELLTVITGALTSVTDPHYYEDERGFQGEFYAQLRMRMGKIALPQGALLREEYQKRLEEHGLRIRPDIILHEPFDPARHRGRDEGNHAVMELKRRATSGTAADAFTNLVAMIDALLSDWRFHQYRFVEDLGGSGARGPSGARRLPCGPS